jgi:hypothetical protein
LFKARLVDVPVVTVTVKVLAVPDPHELFALTEMVPPVLPAVTVIAVVEEVPVHPEGKVQLYEVAPLTAAIE